MVVEATAQAKAMRKTKRNVDMARRIATARRAHPCDPTKVGWEGVK
jgi:hypothetical protein